MTGFDRLACLALEGMMTGRAFRETQVCMFLVQESHDPDFGFKLNSRPVSRYRGLCANRATRVANQQHKNQGQCAHDTHLIICLFIHKQYTQTRLRCN